MKTIDEVIELLDNGCIRPCVECPCYGMKECQEQLAAESYYLHKYQEIEDEYDELKDWWAEEHAENVPLTWDKLKTMIEKPVWVEDNLETPEDITKYWAIMQKIEKAECDEYALLSNFYYQKSEYEKSWIAYRKERS